jgi:hypothetical protein
MYVECKLIYPLLIREPDCSMRRIFIIPAEQYTNGAIPRQLSRFYIYSSLGFDLSIEYCAFLGQLA